MMSQTNTLSQIADEVIKTLCKNPDVLAIWFYGAVQRRRTWPESDVDLLIVTETTPAVAENRAIQNDVIIHLHWMSRSQFKEQIGVAGDRILHSRVGGGELRYDRHGEWSQISEKIRSFPEVYRVYHLIPHLEALLHWSRDLRKRMTLRDERPRRASARQWVVDIHSASILLIEKGIYPHNEPTTQALNCRIFVPNMSSPKEIEQFVEGRIQKWLLPQLKEWVGTSYFNSASLQQQYGTSEIALLLALMARQEFLHQVERQLSDELPLQQLFYQSA